MLETEPLFLDGWTARARIPESPVYPAVSLPPLTLLLHGWQGDETAMWVFANRLPKNHLLVAPRAIYAASQGGYSWVERVQGFPPFASFQTAIQSLLDLLDKIKTTLDHDPGPINFLGFSQGAALAQAFAATYPSRVGLLAGLAGFTPPGIETLLPQQPLSGKRVFVAHGTEDETVSIAIARQGIATLEQLGAKVTYCEDNVGHKLSTHCFRALGAYFA